MRGSNRAVLATSPLQDAEKGLRRVAAQAQRKCKTPVRGCQKYLGLFICCDETRGEAQMPQEGGLNIRACESMAAHARSTRRMTASRDVALFLFSSFLSVIVVTSCTCAVWTFTSHKISVRSALVFWQMGVGRHPIKHSHGGGQTC